MDNFDLKRFLVENKMTRNSRLLNEQPEPDGIPTDDPLAQIPAVPAETPSEPSGEIDKETAKELIFGTKGKFFTVKFIKLDGSERVMNARLGVKKYLKGGTLKYDPAEFNYITVYDMGSKGYRTVNANTIQSLKIGNNEYVVPTTVSESEEPSGYERLYAKVDNLDRNTQVNAYQLLDFVNNLGGNTEDEMVIDAIFYAAQDNNADELITILADTMGEGGGSNDPLAFDGVFTYSDIQQALSGNEMSNDLKSQILDNDQIRNLERG